MNFISHHLHSPIKNDIFCFFIFLLRARGAVAAILFMVFGNHDAADICAYIFIAMSILFIHSFSLTIAIEFEQILSRKINGNSCQSEIKFVVSICCSCSHSDRLPPRTYNLKIFKRFCFLMPLSTSAYSHKFTLIRIRQYAYAHVDMANSIWRC